MDPRQEIDELKAKRDKLEQALAVPGISEAREIAIRHNFDTVGAEITAQTARLPKVELPDERTMWRRGVDSMMMDPVQVGIPAVFGFCTWMYVMAWFYTPIRHQYAPYTPSQMGRREAIFHKVFEGRRVPAAATATVAVSAFLLAVRGWTSNAHVLRIQGVVPNTRSTTSKALSAETIALGASTSVTARIENGSDPHPPTTS